MEQRAEAKAERRVDWRQFMPRVGTRKLYQLIKPQLTEQGIKLGRDGLFQYLK